MKAEYLRDAQESLRRAKELQRQRDAFFQEFAGQLQDRDDAGMDESPGDRGLGKQMDRRERGRGQYYDDDNDENDDDGLGGYDDEGDDGGRGVGAGKEQYNPVWMNPMAISLGFMIMVILAAIVMQNRISTNFLLRER